MKLAILWSTLSFSYTANRVWFDFLPSGRYQITVEYTIPSIRELRTARIEFDVKSEAEKTYFDLLRGADFSPPRERAFVPNRGKPSPY